MLTVCVLILFNDGWVFKKAPNYLFCRNLILSMRKYAKEISSNLFPLYSREVCLPYLLHDQNKFLWHLKEGAFGNTTDRLIMLKRPNMPLIQWGIFLIENMYFGSHMFLGIPLLLSQSLKFVPEDSFGIKSTLVQVTASHTYLTKCWLKVSCTAWNKLQGNLEKWF